MSDQELLQAVPDLQAQVSAGGEYWWHWGLHASLDVGGSGTLLLITDYPGPDDLQDALGYHAVDASYQPYAIIFAALARDHGKPPSAVISHELLEMLADQSMTTVNLIELGDGTALLPSQEVCDPCEDLWYEGPLGTLLSDFALPGWWLPGYQGPVDFLGLVPGPLLDAAGKPFPVRRVTIADLPQPSGAEAGDVLNSAAGAMRDEVSAAFGARVGVVHQLRARAAGTPVQYPAPGPPSGQPGPAALERRKQPARRGSGATVVRRQDVPPLAGRFPV